MRRVDELLDQYSNDHRNESNQAIHVVCVPAIVWSVTAALWAIPVPPALAQPGAWAVVAMFIAWAWYWRLSRPLAMGLFLCFLVCVLLNLWIATRFGIDRLLITGVVVFVIAWVGQFIGHIYEGHRPSFLTDLVFLLVGPMWTLRKLYQRLGIAV
jgi:uncharacterized membrane protein YGL010W